jgi:hypothetical protein
MWCQAITVDVATQIIHNVTRKQALGRVSLDADSIETQHDLFDMLNVQLRIIARSVHQDVVDKGHDKTRAAPTG